MDRSPPTSFLKGQQDKGMASRERLSCTMMEAWRHKARRLMSEVRVTMARAGERDSLGWRQEEKTAPSGDEGLCSNNARRNVIDGANYLGEN